MVHEKYGYMDKCIISYASQSVLFKIFVICIYIYIYIYPVAILAQESATMAGQGARFNPFFWTQGSLVPWGHGVQGQHPPTHGIFWTFRVWGETLGGKPKTLSFLRLSCRLAFGGRIQFLFHFWSFPFWGIFDRVNRHPSTSYDLGLRVPSGHQGFDS